jgi:hypothetical protein
VAREVVAECLPDLSVGAVAVERRGDLVFQAEQLGPDPAAGELAAQRLRFLEETLPHGVPAHVQWDELRQIERSGQLLILTVRRDGQLLGSVWLNLYQDLNTGSQWPVTTCCLWSRARAAEWWWCTCGAMPSGCWSSWGACR